VPAAGDIAIDALGALLGLAAWEGPGPLAARTVRAAAWGLGLAAGLGLLAVPIDVALGRPAAARGHGARARPDRPRPRAHSASRALGLARLARPARIRVSSGPRAPEPP
jgi:hypothetical protein